MTRRREKPPTRTCALTRRSGPPETMIRFVLAPDGSVVPDIRRRLPGRGVWIDATHDSVASAVTKRAFARGFKAQVAASDGLADEVERLLRRAALERLAMAHKAGLVTAGFEKVRAVLSEARTVGLIVAADAAADSRQKLETLAKKACDLHNKRNVVDGFSSIELESTLGRERVVFAALAPGRLSELFLTDTERLHAYRNGGTRSVPHREHQPDEHTFAGPLAV
nr:RNA-binding protein [Acuticoccus mangrovi]